MRNRAASGGAERETAAQAQARLLRELNTTRKCVSAADYERLARETPGLRVAAAKALPAYDPEEPTGVSRLPTVTVVAVPAGAGERPLPDRRFLAAVQAPAGPAAPHRHPGEGGAPGLCGADRPGLPAGRRGRRGAALEAALRAFLAGSGIGGVLRAGDVAALVQAAPGVLQVRRGGPAHHRARLLSERGRGHPAAPPGHPAAEGAAGGAPAGGADRPLRL